MRFVITTHARLDGVFLSSPGHFGNLPFADDAAAAAHARELAGNRAFAIERERVRTRIIPR